MTSSKSNISIYHRIWVYSRAEAEQMKSLNSGVSASDLKLGTVVTDNGIAQPYTSIVRNSSEIREADAVIVATGDIRKVHFTPRQIS